MNIPHISLFITESKSPKKKGVAYIHLQFGNNNNSFTLKKSVKKNQWKPSKKGFVIKDNELNYWLQQKVAHGRKVIQNYADKGIIVDFETFKKEFWGIKNIDKTNQNLYTYWQQLNDKDLAKGKIKQKTTYLQRNSHLNTWKKYAPKLSFNLTRNDIDNFITVRRAKGIAISSIHVDLQKLSYVLDRAIEDEIIKKNIVKSFANEYLSIAKKHKKEKDILTEEEREQFKKYYIEHHQDFIEGKRNRLGAFLLMCYTGMNYDEIINLSYSNIEKTEINSEVHYIIKRNRGKTNREYMTIIPHDLLFLIYNRDKINPEDFVFKKFDLSYCNRTLPKFFNKELGINKHITTHTARHTFGSLRLESGHRLSSVQKMLGHAKISQTQTYAKVSAKGLINESIQLSNKNRKLDRSNFNSNVLKMEKDIILRLDAIRKTLNLSEQSFSIKYFNVNHKKRFEQLLKLIDGDTKAPFLSIIELLQILQRIGITPIEFFGNDYEKSIRLRLTT